MADLSKVFDQFANTANEGEAAVLSKKKVKRALKALGVDNALNADDILDKMDADKDGCIDKEEWAKHMTPELKAAIEAKLQDSGLVSGFKPLVDIARIFDQLDTDKSGDLSRDEIKHALEVLGLQANYNIDDLLKDMDTDGNGNISIEEFKNGLPKDVLQTMSGKLTEKGLIAGV
jgi:Ca2+-binding EF-hand superfamily protein